MPFLYSCLVFGFLIFRFFTLIITVVVVVVLLLVFLFVKKSQISHQSLVSCHIFLRETSQKVLLLKPSRLLHKCIRAAPRPIEKHPRTNVLSFDLFVEAFADTGTLDAKFESLGRVGVVDPLLDLLHRLLQLILVARRERLKSASLRVVLAHPVDALFVQFAEFAHFGEIYRIPKQSVKVEVVLRQ